MMRYVSVIFTPEPGQWGLRGDPFLWRLLKELPYPPEALREDILCVFADLTGELPAPGKHYYVERFAKTHVGMSTRWTHLHLLTTWPVTRIIFTKTMR